MNVFLSQGLSLGEVLTKQAKLADSKAQDPSVSSSPTLRIQVHTTMPSVFTWGLGVDSGPPSYL